MKLYYNFSVLDHKDFEIDVADERIALFLATILDFTAEEIITQIDTFRHLYEKEILKHFSSLAKHAFENTADLNERTAKSTLRAFEINKNSQKCARERRKRTTRGVDEV